MTMKDGQVTQKKGSRIRTTAPNRNGVNLAIRDALLPKLVSGEIRVGAAEKVVEEVA